MRRLGVFLLAAGLAGFLYASSRKARYETSPGEPPSMSTAAGQAVYTWETARWLLVGTAVIGLVFTSLFALGLLMASLWPTSVSIQTIVLGNILAIADEETRAAENV